MSKIETVGDLLTALSRYPTEYRILLGRYELNPGKIGDDEEAIVRITTEEVGDAGSVTLWPEDWHK